MAYTAITSGFRGRSPINADRDAVIDLLASVVNQHSTDIVPGAASSASPTFTGVITLAGQTLMGSATLGGFLGDLKDVKAWSSVYTADPENDYQVFLRMTSHQGGTVTQQRQLLNLSVEDDASTIQTAVSGAVNNGSGLIRLTVAASAPLVTGDRVQVWGVTGTVEANAVWNVTVVDATHVDLQGSTFTNAYVSGGTLGNTSLMYPLFIQVAPRFARISNAGPAVITGAAAHGDDVTGLVFYNQSTFGTFGVDEAVYVGHNPAFPAGTPEWWAGVHVKGNVNYGFKIGGNVITAGIDMSLAVFAAGANAINMGAVPLTIASTSPAPVSVTVDGATAALRLMTYSGVASSGSILRLRRAEGSLAAPTGLLNGDNIGQFLAQGTPDGTTFQDAGYFQISATENWSSTNKGTSISFAATPVGTTTPLVVFNINGTNLLMGNSKNIQVGTVGGTQIATATNQLLGFYGAAPIVQRSGAAQTAVAATGSTNVTPFGFTTAAQADSIVTLVNEIRAWAVAQGFIKGSA